MNLNYKITDCYTSRVRNCTFLVAKATKKFSSGDQNFIAGRQLATCKAGCYCRLSRSEKMIRNWNLEAICQQGRTFCPADIFLI